MSKVKRWWINVKWLLYSCHGIHQIIRAVEIWMVLVVRGASALRRPISMPSSTGTPNQFIQDDNILSIFITYGLLIFEFYCSSQDRGLFIQDFVFTYVSLWAPANSRMKNDYDSWPSWCSDSIDKGWENLER